MRSQHCEKGVESSVWSSLQELEFKYLREDPYLTGYIPMFGWDSRAGKLGDGQGVKVFQ